MRIPLEIISVKHGSGFHLEVSVLFNLHGTMFFKNLLEIRFRFLLLYLALSNILIYIRVGLLYLLLFICFNILFLLIGISFISALKLRFIALVNHQIFAWI